MCLLKKMKKKRVTYIVSPRKSSLVNLSLSISLKLSSATLSATVKRKLSFQRGLDPASIN